jgi:hypothetical protein
MTGFGKPTPGLDTTLTAFGPGRFLADTRHCKDTPRIWQRTTLGTTFSNLQRHSLDMQLEECCGLKGPPERSLKLRWHLF